jgi:hypothetical protein
LHGWQGERNGRIASGRDDALKAEAQGRCVTAEGHRYGLPGERFGFTVEKRQGGLRCLVARATWAAGIALSEAPGRVPARCLAVLTVCHYRLH